MSLTPLKITAIRRTENNHEIIFPNALVSITTTSGAYAVLKQDSAGTIPLSNPFSCDPNGERQVFLNGGDYDVSVSGGASWKIHLDGSGDIKVVENIASLKATKPDYIGQKFNTIGNTVAGYGSGFFFHTGTVADASSNNDGTVIVGLIDGIYYQFKKTDYSIIYIEDFGGLPGSSNDCKPKILAAINAGVKEIYFQADDYYFSPIDLPVAASGCSFIGKGSGVAYQKVTRFLPYSSSQNHIFRSNLGGTDAIKFKGLRFFGQSSLSFGVQQISGAGWSFEDVSCLGAFIDTALSCLQGLNQYSKTYTFLSGGKGLSAYSDFSISNCEFSGGSVPLTIAAGGGRITNVLCNSGSESCLDLVTSPGVNHINTSIEGLYIGETYGGSTIKPIIRCIGTSTNRVRQVQWSNIHMVCGDTTVDHKNTMIVASYCDDFVFSSIDALGFGDFATANRYVDGFAKLDNCKNWNFESGVVADVSKWPFRITDSTISIGSTFHVKNWGDPQTTGDEFYCIISDANSYVTIADTDFIAGRVNGCKAGKSPSANRWKIGKVRNNMAGSSGNIFDFADNMGSWEEHTGDDPATYSKGSHITLKGTFSSASGGGATAILTMPNVAANQCYSITIQQTGNAQNASSGMVFSYAGTSAVITTGNTNTSTLANTFTASGNNIGVNIGSGYGVTTWQYQLTRML